MLRRRPVLLVTAAAAAAALAVPASATSSTPGWTATATRAVILLGAASLGSPPAAEQVPVTVVLQPRDKAALDALVRAQATPGSASYHQWLSPRSYEQRFAPSAATVRAVQAHLRGAGLTGVTLLPGGGAVAATGTPAALRRAFHTTLGRFRLAGHDVLVPTAGASMPAALAPAVAAVLGLDTIPAVLPHRTAASPSLAGFTVRQLATSYGAAGTPTGSLATVAVVAQGDLTQTVRDLRIAEARQHLPQAPVTVVRTGPASRDTAGTGEWDLDTQTATGVAGAVGRLVLYDATTLSDSDLFRAFSRFASDARARTGSASLGECDLQAYLDGAAVAIDAVLERAAAQGQTLLASTGDTGAACPVANTNGVPDSGLPGTEYPASSPYALAVGGTTLLASSTGAYSSEVAWNAGGGGVSAVEPPAPWTARSDPAYPLAGASPTGGGRGVPDVAADADPATGALIYTAGAFTPVGGTSLSSPLWLGVLARVQSARRNHLGFLPPLLYGLHDRSRTSATPGLHDVVLGSNGAYSAAPGYDLTTGLGTPSVRGLLGALR